MLRFIYEFLKAFKFAAILVHCSPYSSVWKEGTKTSRVLIKDLT